MIRNCSCRSWYRLYIGIAVACVAVVPAWAQFETRAINPFPSGAFAISTGDFNQDGKLDVVMITEDGFSVALGNGDGTFQKALTYDTQLFYSLAVADVNNDGKPDIVVANLVPSTVRVYLGNGDGTFQSPIDSNTTEGSYFVVVGDFNNDKKPDVAIIDPPFISVLLGNGDGTFQAPSDNDSFVGGKWLAVGDFNNDHELDVIVAGQFGGSDSLGVLLGNGDGTLQDSLTYPLQYVPFGLAAGRLSHSGNIDAVIGYFGAISVLLGNGDGTFQPQVYYEPTGLGGGPVIVADLNLDGKLDVATPGGSPGMDVFWGNGDGTLQSAQFFSSGPESGLPAVGDLNGDGMPDFALGNADVGVITMLNSGVVNFSPTSPLAFPTQLMNTKSASQVVTLRNSGKAALSIRSIKASGEFQISDTCGSSVAAGAKCIIKTVFEPTAAGAQTGLITILDSASSKPQFIELSGIATAVKISPSSLNFGDVKVGTKSAPKVLTVTNEGSKLIQFSSIYITGTNMKDFMQSDTCLKQALGAGATCSVSVIFSPTGGEAESAQLNFSLKNAINPLAVALSGTGD
jgi:hypothetical protein